jgi:hypothetical protein
MNSLTKEDFAEAANILGCEVAAIQAVCTVEAPKGGFNPDGSLASLFEGHKFFKYTGGKYAADHPTICYPKWTTQFYGHTWQAEQARLEEAMALDQKAALMSASFGKFQIMGFNFALCGFTAVESFWSYLKICEKNHLMAFCEYVKHVRLDDELRAKNWSEFAKGYNGPEYMKNNYDQKLAKAYAQYI